MELLPAGPIFKENLEKYWRPLIIKGVPSVINDSSFMYKDEGKVNIIGEMIGGMCSSMENDMSLN